MCNTHFANVHILQESHRFSARFHLPHTYQAFWIARIRLVNVRSGPRQHGCRRPGSARPTMPCCVYSAYRHSWTGRVARKWVPPDSTYRHSPVDCAEKRTVRHGCNWRVVLVFLGPDARDCPRQRGWRRFSPQRSQTQSGPVCRSVLSWHCHSGMMSIADLSMTICHHVELPGFATRAHPRQRGWRRQQPSLKNFRSLACLYFPALHCHDLMLSIGPTHVVNALSLPPFAICYTFVPRHPGLSACPDPHSIASHWIVVRSTVYVAIAAHCLCAPPLLNDNDHHHVSHHRGGWSHMVCDLYDCPVGAPSYCQEGRCLKARGKARAK